MKGNEFRAGVELAIETAKEIQTVGVLRYLDRIYGIKQYLDKLSWELGHISMPLREVLDGGEYREI